MDAFPTSESSDYIQFCHCTCSSHHLCISVYVCNLCVFCPISVYENSNMPFSYMLCLLFKKAYRELKLERALDEDTGPGEFSFFFSTGPYMYLMYVFSPSL